MRKEGQDYDNRIYKIRNYHFPNIKETQEIQLSKYGRMKLNYLKDYQKGLYLKLLSINQLNSYLQDIDKKGNDMNENFLIDFKMQRNITEELKEKDQMKWVQEMNNIQNCIDEIILKNIIYC